MGGPRPDQFATTLDPELDSGTLPLRGLAGRLARGIAWNLIGTVFNQGSTFVTNILLARLWEIGVFGEYAIVQSTMATVSAASQVAMGSTATKYLAEFRARDPERAGRILGLCTVVAGITALLGAAVLVLAARRLAASALNQPQLEPVLVIAAGWVFFAVIIGFLIGALGGLEAYDALATAGVISGTVYVVFCVGGGWLYGVPGAIAGQALSGVVQCAILIRLVAVAASAQRITWKLGSLFGETPVLLRFAMPAALNGCVALPSIWLAQTALVRQLGGYDQLALFTAANSFRIMVLFLPNIVNTVGMSLLNNQRGAGSESRYRRVFWTNLTLTVALLVAGAAVVLLGGRHFLLLFGPGFAAAYGILCVLMIETLPEGLAMATVQTIQSHERVWLIFIARVLPSYLVLVMVAYATVPAYGAMGLAWGYLAGWTTALALDTLIVWRTGLWPARADAGVSGV